MKYYKLDTDTKAYLKRMAVDGIKTPADIYSVNDFVVGLKDLNLWQNCSIFCFRSNQNAGTGTSVYGFGNRMMYKETLNGANWSGNGLVFSSTAHNLTRSFTIFNSPFSFILIDKKEILSAAIRLRFFGVFPNKYGDTNPANARSFNVRDLNNGGYAAFTPTANTNFLVKGMTLNTTSDVNGYSNGSSLSVGGGGSVVGGWDACQDLPQYLLEATVGSDSSIIVPFFGFWNRNLSAIEHLNFYNLYKATAGKGLNLP